MKQRIALFLAGLIILTSSTAVLASVVTGAKYLTTIAITNSGTAATNCAANFTLSTADMISQGMLNATATDAAMRDGTGTDVVFMPSVNSTYQWWTWVPTIGASSQINQYLYSNNATGGKIRYFPAAAGMSVADNETLECSGNFSYQRSGYIGTTSTLASKGGVFSVSYNATSGNATASLGGGWVYPTGNGAVWNSPTNAYDANTATYAGYNTLALNWSPYFVLYQTWFTNVAIYPTRENVAITTMQVDVWNNGGWQQIYNATPTYTANQTITSANVSSDWVRVRFYNTDGVFAYQARVNEIKLYQLQSISIAAAAGDRNLAVTSNTTSFGIQVDSGTWQTAANITMPDNGNTWYFEQGTDYVDQVNIYVGGNPKGSWNWEYGATFTDDSGNGNTATPTFRTAPTDADIVASITSMAPTDTSSGPTTNTTAGWVMIPTVPTAPGTAYTTGAGDYPLKVELTALAVANGIPPSAVIYFFAIMSSVVAFVLVFLATHVVKAGIRGSMLFASGASVAVLIYWTMAGGGAIPTWIFIPIGVAIALLLMWRNPNSTPI